MSMLARAAAVRRSVVCFILRVPLSVVETSALLRLLVHCGRCLLSKRSSERKQDAVAALRVGAEVARGVADALHKVGVGPLGDGINNGITLIMIAARHLDLDQLVMLKRKLDLGQDGLAKAGGAELDDWLEVVRLLLQPAALMVGDGDGLRHVWRLWLFELDG